MFRLYLEDEDHVNGEMYINRAAQLQTQTKNEELQIVYKASILYVQEVVTLQKKYSNIFASKN